MKTISELICKECGLEYEIFLTDTRLQDKDGNLCSSYSYKLNFDEPENFLTLFNLDAGDGKTVAALIAYLYSITSTKRFLRNLYQHLKDNKYIFQNEELKKKICRCRKWRWK